MNNLVIVESPTKARTLSRFLGSDYKIEASMGHIRDLPKSEFGVEIEKGFEPKYIIPRDKKKKVNELKKIADQAKTLWLATDPDREGEAIAWHLAYLLGKGHTLKRVEFHEITENAVKDAFKHPREINEQLVDAQQARRVLDRVVGYKLSPLLWKKVKRGLSAGRVQSVALRLIVEREKEIEAFKPQEYWSIVAVLEPDHATKKSDRFNAELIEYNGKKLEIKEEGKVQKGFFITNKEEADTHIQNLEKAYYIVKNVTKKEVRRFSPAPFTTSTMQQTAGNRLSMSAKKTMMLAQNLYEHGLITYMRTDSVNLSAQAVENTRALIEKQFGTQYLPEKSKIYRAKSKNAQEAHEAIRPTNVTLTPEALNGEWISRDHRRLYELIWKRTIASQMEDAVFDQTSVDVEAKKDDAIYVLRATGSVLKFDGWLKLYGVKQEVEEESEEGDKQKSQILPELEVNEPLGLQTLLPEQHFTQPPPRYTEAALIKKLEELGIGRPSTYAPILSTIQDRFYVEKQEKKFVPTVLGRTTMDFLIKHFPDIFDYTFTASMEDQLDEIARGERVWQETLKTFYSPFEDRLEKTMETAERATLPVETVDKTCPQCGKQLLIRTSRFGKFLACSGFPDCKYTENLVEKIDTPCPKCGGEIVSRRTKKGKPFYGCSNWPKCTFASWTKPVEVKKKSDSDQSQESNVQ